jgi:hypothetical protein
MVHTLATAELVQLRGSEGFAEDLAHKLFDAVRLVVVNSGFCFYTTLPNVVLNSSCEQVYVSTARRQPSFLACEEWLTDPFRTSPKPNSTNSLIYSQSSPSTSH